MKCNSDSDKAKDPKYICNQKTGKWVLKTGKIGQDIVSKKQVIPTGKQHIKPIAKQVIPTGKQHIKQVIPTGKYVPKPFKPYLPQHVTDYISKTSALCLSNKIPLQAHQIDFVKSFMKMCKYDKQKHGAIAVHSLGSGKTLTAIMTSQCYLKMYPNDNVIVITPASLITNFQKEMEKWGAENMDKYHFFTYDDYKNKMIDCKNSLLIVDEAHNLRTQIKVVKGKDTGVKVSAVIDCAKNARKVLLLTGTPIVNESYDIENLMAMIYKREPLTKTKFYAMTEYQLHNYFNCVVSFFKSTPLNYPSTEEHDIFIKMSPEYYKKYMYIEDEVADKFEKLGFGEGKNLTAFYNGLRRATTKLDEEKSPKIQWIYNLIKNSNPKDKFVVFSHFKDSGAKLLGKVLDANGIKYKIIDGSIPKKKRQEYVDMYNHNKLKVVIITKAGGEGISFLGTTGIIIIEPSWNETTSNQVIGRAVRYKSHEHLPVEKQKVDIYKLYMLKPKEDAHVKANISKKTLPTIVDEISDATPSIDIYLKAFSLKKQTNVDAFLNYMKNTSSLEKCF